jgi:hypothetical protein
MVSEMRYLVVGGQGRGVGKTALVVDIIRAFPEAGWTAVKISPHGHGAWTEPGEPSEGGSAGQAALLQEETDRIGQSDSSRYLAAGARRSFWLRTQPGALAEGMTLLRGALEGAQNVILESNAVLEFIRPALYLVVLDPELSDFKESARRFIGLADGFVLRHSLPGATWQGVAEQRLRERPIFEQRLGEPLPGSLVLLIRERLFAPVHPGTPEEHLPR